MSDEWFLFYGSLRRGMHNHSSYEHGLEFHDEQWLRGYRMYAMRHYPYVVKTGAASDLILCELFRIRDRAISMAIHDMELSVGYTLDRVRLGKRDAIIYVFEKAGNEPVVAGGDWVEFFGKTDTGQH